MQISIVRSPCRLRTATINPTERGRKEAWGFRQSVERANICDAHARVADLSGAAVPYIGSCEMVPTTPARLHALTKCSEGSRVAYGDTRPPVVAPHRSSTMESWGMRTEPYGSLPFPVTVTTGARKARRLHQTTTSSPKSEISRNRTIWIQMSQPRPPRPADRSLQLTRYQRPNAICQPRM